MGITIRQTHYELIPVGEHVAKITEVTEEDGQYGPQLKLTFALDQAGRTLVGWCSRTFSAKSKLYAWARAAFGGRAIPEDWDFDSDKILGRMVRLVVVTQSKEGGETYNKIADVRPARAGDALPTAILAEEPEPEPAWEDLPETEEVPF